MDFSLEMNENKKIDIIKLHKMAFIYNALEDGWTIKKNNNNYIFTKNHKGKKEVYLDSYLKNFIAEKFNLNILD
jgi:hypothetical protein